MEDWKIIKDFEDYAISNTGKVKRITECKCNHTYVGKILKTSYNNCGYVTVTLFKKKAYCRTIHRLVAEAFLDKPEDFNLQKYDVDHIDNDKTNNNVTNLQWLTHKDNSKKSLSELFLNKPRPDWMREKMKEGWKKWRERNGKEYKKVKYYEVNYNGEIYEFKTQKEIKEKFNISVRYILRGECKNKNITITKKYKYILKVE